VCWTDFARGVVLLFFFRDATAHQFEPIHSVMVGTLISRVIAA
jgi:hypothetical protein